MDDDEANPNVLPDAGAINHERLSNPLDLRNVTSSVDRTCIKEIEKKICTLQHNMPHLHKHNIVKKADYYMVMFDWKSVSHFYLDVDVLVEKVLNDQYVKNLYISTTGLIVHIWKHQSFLNRLSKTSTSSTSRYHAGVICLTLLLPFASLSFVFVTQT